MPRVFYVLLGLLMVPTVGIAGDIQTDGKLKSTLPSGAPLEVASPDMVVNLNADMVDGVQGTDIYTKAEVDALVAAAVESATPRKYYLSSDSNDGNEALTRCATGYHMASVWEIFNPSALEYAFDHPDAYVQVDSGTGAPAGVSGWVRTGASSQTADSVGWSNCAAYTSDDLNHYGTVIFLAPGWSDPTLGGTFTPVPGSTWLGSATLCNSARGTWCIED